MTTIPSPSRSAVSTLSARRVASGSGIGTPVRVERPAGGGIARRALRRLGVADDVAVDDDLDRVALVLVERPRVGEVHRLAVDPDADEALAPGALEDPVALGLAVLDERAEHDEPRPLRQRQDLVDDLLDRLALDLVAVRAVRVADAREEQPQVVVDLGHGADGRSRVARRRPSGRSRWPARARRSASTSGFSIWPRNWRA